MRCIYCDYRLDYLVTNSCPECGRPFDPGNPETFQAGSYDRRGAKRALLLAITLWAAALIVGMILFANGVAEVPFLTGGVPSLLALGALFLYFVAAVSVGVAAIKIDYQVNAAGIILILVGVSFCLGFGLPIVAAVLLADLEERSKSQAQKRVESEQ